MAMITSCRGSVKGLEGGVYSTLQSLLQRRRRLEASPAMLRILEEEAPSEEDGRAGKMVVYMTSLQAVRETHDLCHRVVQVLRGHGVSLTLKDVFLHPDYSKELSERMGAEGAVLPQVFINGRHVGDGPTIVQLNESGQLAPMLAGIEVAEPGVCRLCGGQQFILCLWCKGTKKGIRNTFSDLKCTVCNKNALQKCPECSM